MKAIILTIVVLLWWQCGYCQQECSVKKKKNIFVARIKTDEWINSWEEYVNKQNTGDACLKVLVPENIKIKLRHIRQIYNVYASYMDKYVTHIRIESRITDTNEVGIYDLLVANDSLETRGCALYNGKQIMLPHAPTIRRDCYPCKKIPTDIYQARLEVVEMFLKKHDNFTEEQKKEIVKIFTDGFYLPPLHGRTL